LLTRVPTLAGAAAKVFFVILVWLTSTFLSGLLIRVTSWCLLAEVLFAKIIVLTRATHFPVEIVVRHSVMCHRMYPSINGDLFSP
jgi:hypothetical protein